MNGSSSLDLGFWLARRDIRNADLPDRPYRGADRLPLVPEPIAPGDGTVSWPSPWPEYFDAEDSGELHRDRSVAEALSASFEGVSIGLELAYLRITRIPTPGELPTADVVGEEWDKSLRWLQKQVGDVPPVPSDFICLGDDIAMSLPSFTSKIYWGLARWRPEIVGELNEYGLLESEAIALKYLQEANLRHHGIPDSVFAIYGVRSAD